MQVVLAANDMPSINDVTYVELVEIVKKVGWIAYVEFLYVKHLGLMFILLLYQLKDENEQILGVDTSGLLIVNSGNDLPVRNWWQNSVTSITGLDVFTYSTMQFLKQLDRCVYFQVIDLTCVSPELAYVASDADLVILEGMVSSVIKFPFLLVQKEWGTILHLKSQMTVGCVLMFECFRLSMFIGTRNRDKLICSIKMWFNQDWNGIFFDGRSFSLWILTERQNKLTWKLILFSFLAHSWQVKHPEVAQFLGGRLYDCVFKYNEVLNYWDGLPWNFSLQFFS